MNIHDINISSFNYYRFIIITVSSFIIVYLAMNKCNNEQKITLGIIALLIYVYSGVGGSLDIVPFNYIIYYILFYILFINTFSIIAFKKRNNNRKYLDELYIDNKIFTSEVNKVIISSYIILHFIIDYYPDYNITKLFILSKPVLVLTTTISSKDIFQTILYYILLLLQPFYFISLYEYKSKIYKLFILLFIPIYITYTKTGYLGRSTLFPYLIIYIATIFYYNKDYRKTILLVVILLIGPIITLLVYYSYWRLGANIKNLSFLQAINTLFFQEMFYPVYYEYIYNRLSDTKIYQYLIWLITLPIPNFLKSPDITATINYDFSEMITGISRKSKDFNVLLPGVVTESIMIFGKYLMIVMPIFSGALLGWAYKITNYSKRFYVLKIYFTIFIGLSYARAGGGAAFPLIINGFILLYVFYYYINNKLNQFISNKYNSFIKECR